DRRVRRISFSRVAGRRLFSGRSGTVPALVSRRDVLLVRHGHGLSCSADGPYGGGWRVGRHDPAAARSGHAHDPGDVADVPAAPDFGAEAIYLGRPGALKRQDRPRKAPLSESSVSLGTVD